MPKLFRRQNEEPGLERFASAERRGTRAQVSSPGEQPRRCRSKNDSIYGVVVVVGCMETLTEDPNCV